MILYYITDEKGSVTDVSTASSMQTPYSARFEGLIDLEKLKGLKVENGLMEYDENLYLSTIKAEEEAIAREQAEKQLAYYEAEKRLEGLDDEQAFDCAILFPHWEPGIKVKAGKRLYYEGNIYKVVKDHITQADWLPNLVPSDYTLLPDPNNPFPPYKQPLGAHDAYMKGDKITFNDKHYICKQDAVVRNPEEQPGAWEEVAGNEND